MNIFTIGKLWNTMDVNQKKIITGILSNVKFLQKYSVNTFSEDRDLLEETKNICRKDFEQFLKSFEK